MRLSPSYLLPVLLDELFRLPEQRGTLGLGILLGLQCRSRPLRLLRLVALPLLRQKL